MPKTRPFACDYKGRVDDIGFWVHKQMKLHQMNQTDLAEVIEVDQSNVSKKLDPNQSATFTIIELMKLVDLFKPTDKELLNLFK